MVAAEGDVMERTGSRSSAERELGGPGGGVGGTTGSAGGSSLARRGDGLRDLLGRDDKGQDERARCRAHGEALKKQVEDNKVRPSNPVRVAREASQCQAFGAVLGSRRPDLFAEVGGADVDVRRGQTPRTVSGAPRFGIFRPSGAGRRRA